MKTPDDLRGLIEGEENAWKAFVLEYCPYLRAVVLRLLARRSMQASTETVDDIVQDILVRLIEKDFHVLRRHDPAKAAFRTWLTNVSRLVTLNTISRPTVATAPLEEDCALSIPAPVEIEPESLLSEAPLSPQDRRILQLLHFEGRPAQEAAKELRLAVQTVYNRNSRIIRRIRAFLLGK